MEGMEEQVGCGTRFSSEFSGQLYMFCLFVCLFVFSFAVSLPP